MQLRYDLHLHSCLSPCGDEDMTPYNLVQMAGLLGLDIIALTDHNSAGNCRSAMAVGKEAGVTVVPGMELCTAEEIHVVCLFPDAGRAESFSAMIRTLMLPFPNDPAVFGRQVYMDAADSVLGEEELLLVGATTVGIDDVGHLVGDWDGFCFPAHIDRSSYSILSSLGAIDADMGFRCAEISDSGDAASLVKAHPALKDMRILRSSDAHYLDRMREAVDTVELAANTPEALLAYLRGL